MPPIDPAPRSSKRISPRQGHGRRQSIACIRRTPIWLGQEFAEGRGYNGLNEEPVGGRQHWSWIGRVALETKWIKEMRLRWAAGVCAAYLEPEKGDCMERRFFPLPPDQEMPERGAHGPPTSLCSCNHALALPVLPSASFSITACFWLLYLLTFPLNDLSLEYFYGPANEGQPLQVT